MLTVTCHRLGACRRTDYGSRLFVRAPMVGEGAIGLVVGMHNG